MKSFRRNADQAGVLRYQWLAACTAAAVFLVVVTGIARLNVASGTMQKILYKLTLAVENNVGAWASGMLLLLLAILAYDGYARYADSAPGLARAWAILAAIVAFFSFDEIASMHERLGSFAHSLDLNGWTFVIPLGLVLAAFYLRAMYLFWRSGRENRGLALVIFVGFALLGSVAVQEYIEERFAWTDVRLDALRVAFEEATEIAGMLVLLAVFLANAAPFAKDTAEPQRPTFALLAERWRAIAAAALALAPIAALVSVLVDDDGRGRPSDWIAAALFTAAALLVVRPYLARRLSLPASAWAAAGLCLIASVADLLVPVTSTRVLLGAEISTRLAALGAVALALALVRLGVALRWHTTAAAPYGMLTEAALILPFFMPGPWGIYMLSQLLAIGVFCALARDAHLLPQPAAAPVGRLSPRDAPAGVLTP